MHTVGSRTSQSVGRLVMQGFGPVEVCRLLWGLAVLDQLPKTAAASLYNKLAQMPLTSFTAESLEQVLQVRCGAVLRCAVLCFEPVLLGC